MTQTFNYRKQKRMKINTIALLTLQTECIDISTAVKLIHLIKSVLTDK